MPTTKMDVGRAKAANAGCGMDLFCVRYVMGRSLPQRLERRLESETKMKRIRLSRKKGWKLPENTVVVSRPTKWGNPFIVSKHGTREECVRKFELLCSGYYCVSLDSECADAQQRFMHYAKKHLAMLRGKNLACWCALDAPCHADILLQIANKP